VLTAGAPQGPFTLQTVKVNVSRQCPGPAASEPCGPMQGGVGGFDVFVDDDGEGYIVYYSKKSLSIERLTPDFLHSTGENASCGGNYDGTDFPDYFIEAPVFFKRHGIYYVLHGHDCCFCVQGSGIMVYKATSPLGPWEPQPGGDLACVDENAMTPFHNTIQAKPTPGQGCKHNGPHEVSVTRSQQNFVIEAPNSINNDSTYIWTGAM